MGTAIKYPVPDRVKLPFVIFDIRALWRSALSSRVPGCQKLQMGAYSHSFLFLSSGNYWPPALSNGPPDARNLVNCL